MYNLCNEIFKGIATFKEVTRTREDNTTYPGLEITMKFADGSSATQTEIIDDEDVHL